MTTAIAVPPPADTMAKTAEIMLKSGMFGGMKTAAEALTKLKLGQSLGIDPLSALSQIILVNGKPTMSAGLQARLIKGSGKYRYEVREKTAEKCVLEFYELLDDYTESGKAIRRWKSIGLEEFNKKDAETAGLTTGGNSANWKKFPKNMLFCRCLTNGFRTHCPDAGAGQTIYLPDEINSKVQVDYSSEGGAVVAVEGEEVDDSTTRRQALATLIADAGSDPAKLLKFYADQSGGSRKTVADLTDAEVEHAIDTLTKRLSAGGAK